MADGADETAAQDALRALARLGDLGDAEGRNALDPQLNRLLAPLRSHPLIRIQCSCGYGIAWAAVAPGFAAVVATQKRVAPGRARGGEHDLDDPSRGAPIRGFPGWIEAAQEPGSSVRIDDWKNPAGIPLRLSFACRRCGQNFPTTNTYRLTHFLRAIATGLDRMIL